MKNKGAKTKIKRKGAFGCDLTEHLETSGQDVPLVLKSCAEFIEEHGVVDGIYRLSGVTSNIQKLRQEFVSDQCPDLTREVYLQDIHCVGSLCKLYFRELPNPLLTYQLYTKFTDAVSCSVEGNQLSQIQNVIQELPPSHYRTLEYLSRHLTHIASFSSTTNMHIRNLALVWAPNLLRSKEIEDSGCNGDAAFMEVRVQQVVIEFILNHVDQIFSKCPMAPIKHRDPEDLFLASKPAPIDCRIVKSMTLPTGSLPMKLVSLEEAQARSLSATHPARKERRENSLPEIVPVTGTLFHTVIDLPENKRKLSTKSKKWRSIFNLGRSGTESKSKLSRNGSVFVRGQKEMGDKATIRPAKSMDSLCSLPTEGEDEKAGRFKRPVGAGGFFIPVLRSRASGSGSAYDVSKQDSEWDSEEAIGARGGSSQDKTTHKTPLVKPPPEQMKVFRIGDELDNEQNSPKGRKMFYTSSEGSTKSGFPGSLFPLEASPRHQRKALNISEPFAVSVPLRVSAVINANSTPCRANSKERHLLSSLEELPLLEPDAGPKSPGADSITKSGLKTGPGFPDVAEPVRMHEPRRPCLKDLSPDLFEEDDRTLTLKEILLEMSQLPDILPSSASDRRPIEHTFVSINELPVVKDLEPKKPEPVNSPVEEKTLSDLDDLFLNDQDDDTSINLLDPLWSNIQQELKITESEEDLSTHSESTMDPKRTPSPLSATNLKVESDGVTDVLSSLHTELISESVDADGVKKDAKSQKDSLIPSVTNKLERSNTVPQESQETTVQDQPVIDHPPSKLQTLRSSAKLVPDRSDKEDATIEKGAKKECGKKLEMSVDLEKVENLEDKVDERKSSESLDNDDYDLEVESVHTFELEEFWEDHHWVTSPLHSPKLKNFFEKAPAIPPKRRGTTGELYKRPEFTRSLSLDSKDTRASQWTMKVAEMKADGGSYIRTRTDQIFNLNMQREPRHCQVIHNLPEVPLIGNKSDCCPINNEMSPYLKSMVNLSWVRDGAHQNSTIPLNDMDNLSNAQDIQMPPKVCNQVEPIENNIGNDKEVSEKSKTRPSSLTMDAASTSGAIIFTFENSNPPDYIVPKSQQVHQSSTVSTIALYDRSKSLNEKPSLPSQSTSVDYKSTNHHPMSRRNSAPVSVSAVRASFMIKMCQAKAVPVIPPKVQYTQIPQPLQTVNAESEVPDLEKKDVVSEPDQRPKQPLPPLTGHNDVPKSLKTEVKLVEEKENNDPITVDNSHHSGLNSSTDINHSILQDAPVLRRKRISDGEAAGDTPLSSKMERSSGLSRSSFRARSGRPQSLILFSPPFPIMDHPAIDTKILLSPIKSQTQTNQESTGENQRTPDGVILRNKMTIPKNGQRLETSTSCFYQPQRRSVILDSRSGRQIE
ncbi:rho GTPase-activating protein 31 isoform X1 [Dendrobates tinctorius]|uniref:rho GTPase-activating protein 31 isoform X1 n=1 Tax=Dendrobates tinctorius TaxID=92724 RepID=UPI003CC9AF44